MMDINKVANAILKYDRVAFDQEFDGPMTPTVENDIMDEIERVAKENGVHINQDDFDMWQDILIDWA